MKTRTHVSWIGLLALVILISGCGRITVVDIPAAGHTVVGQYDLTGFDEVEVAGFFEAEISQAEGYRVVVEAERALVPYLEVAARGKRLQVGLKSGIRYSLENASQRVEVTLPALARARIDNHSGMQLTGFKTQETLRLEVVGFSSLRGSLDANDVRVEVSHHSSPNLTGSAERVMGQAKDFSSVDLTRLDVGKVDVEVDGRSSVRP